MQYQYKQTEDFVEVELLGQEGWRVVGTYPHIYTTKGKDFVSVKVYLLEKAKVFPNNPQ